jgi:hypothetical protein
LGGFGDIEHGRGCCLAESDANMDDEKLQELLNGLHGDAAKTRALSEFGQVKLGPALTRPFGVVDAALRLETQWAKHLKQIDPIGQNSALMRSFRALDAFNFDSGIGRQMKVIQDAMPAFAFDQVAKIQEFEKLTRLNEQFKWLSAVNVDSDVTRTFRLLTSQRDSKLMRSLNAFNTVVPDPAFTQLFDNVKLGKLGDLVKTWQSIPLADELNDIVAMNFDNLVDSMSHVAETGGCIAVSATPAEIADVQAIIDRAVDRVAEQHEAQLTAFVKEITAQVAALQGTRLHAIITTYLAPLLVGIILLVLAPIADFYEKRGLENMQHTTSPREIKQNVRKNGFMYAAARNELRPFRFVSKVGLEAHTHPSSRSPTLGNLALGQVVVVLEKRKAWTSIAWTIDEESPAAHGWVYSRYVTKIV